MLANIKIIKQIEGKQIDISCHDINAPKIIGSHFGLSSSGAVHIESMYATAADITSRLNIAVGHIHGHVKVRIAALNLLILHYIPP